MKLRNFIIYFILSFVIFAQDTVQTFLEVKSTRVYDFWKKYPQYDGSGVVIFIFDTGVDQGVEGLKVTPKGEIKVIDVQDFTGQGDIKFDEVKYIDNQVDIKGIKVKGIDNISYKAVDQKYYGGLWDEKIFMNSNSGIKDVNGNNKKDDKIPFVVFKTNDQNNEQVWVVYFDLNLNGDISDDKPIMDYKRKFDTFAFENIANKSKLTYSLNIFPNDKKITIHFDDGAHGSHCAGIACGYKINGLNLNGVAPGAKIISIKIGDNSLSGGSTTTQSMKKAIDYANKYSKENKVPCVINMSYGIGSVIEGTAEIEDYLKKILLENPYLYFFTSNGNEGPGLSTTGIPAALPFVFSTGAVLPAQLGNDNYGTFINRDLVLHFSSRGGEVFKPDVVSPGAATSTVPAWSNSDKMWGTSMASPYTSGVAALLLSAALQEFPNVRVPSKVLYDAIRYSAKPLKGNNALDYGFGYVDALAAYDLLKIFLKNNEHLKYQNYNIVTTNYNLESGKSQNVYIRNLDLIDDGFIFNVNVSRADNRDKNFSRSYILKADQPFIILSQQKFYIRNNQPANIRFTLNKKLMEKSGLYVAKITALRDDASKYPEFSFLAVFIKPEKLNESNKYTVNFEGIKLSPGEHIRYYIQVPTGTNQLAFYPTWNKKSAANIITRVINEDGQTIMSHQFNSQYKSLPYSFNADIPKGGVYEIVIHGTWTSAVTSELDLAVEAFGFDIAENKLSTKENIFTLENKLSKNEYISLSGKITSTKKSYKVVMGEDKSSDEVKIKIKPVTLIAKSGKVVSDGKKFVIRMSKEDFNKFTDFAYYVVDSSGKASNKGGFNYNEEEFEVYFVIFGPEENWLEPNAPIDTNATYTLILKGAYANEIKPVTLYIDEYTIYEKLNDYQVKINGKSVFEDQIFDISSKKYKFTFDNPLPKINSDENFILRLNIEKPKDKSLFLDINRPLE